MNIILCTFLQRLPAVLSRIGVILASPLVSYQPQLMHLPPPALSQSTKSITKSQQIQQHEKKP